MSATATPITPQAFAEALKSLTLPSLYAKASELRNSIAHLQRSNDELSRYIAEDAPDGRDKDCEEAIQENEVVMLRMQERIELLKVEVEGRGQRWSEEMEMEMDGDLEANVNGAVGGGVGDVGVSLTGAEAGAGMEANSSDNRNGASRPTAGRAAQPTEAQTNTTAGVVSSSRNGTVDDEAQEVEGGIYL
ncbi:hypothetical protein AJ78_06406 [Emergomyces pasteurianus Ep9510]|uniref:Uncharacterized protein n=1 Tax=Emergomyces pasteurianus Ep9510 TaxID=1447872 RepID=A0A1J9QD48_9EURO|nr:hypothetical protein AJ78_06406 [Emergomyces pasteurianus Ep9510]